MHNFRNGVFELIFKITCAFLYSGHTESPFVTPLIKTYQSCEPETKQTGLIKNNTNTN